jgi:hypothetical protein
MNDFSELEADLRKLRPAPISGDLARRIEQALELAKAAPTAGVLPQPAIGANSWWSFGLGLTALAALLVIGFVSFVHLPRIQTIASAGDRTPGLDKGPASGFKPAGLTQVVYRGRDEGLVFSPNESASPRRRLRYETRQTVQWRNAQTGASVRVSYPAEQVFLTPVSFE